MNNEYIKIVQIKSSIGILPKHKSTLLSLGLKKIGSKKKLNNTNSIRGMIKKISYMLKIEE
ncbi:50S ribosomal protein L30 [Buchnera aphidicola (Ceratoglyphina bambusae)]|uniref:50S ribosomal protein L30 n=1 Tax=Buchnera aphidicola TaxID=9 RepID=UPI0031B858B4